MKDDEQQPAASFQLRPFSLGVLEANLSLGGSLTRTSAGLVIEYRLQGSLHDLNLSSRSSIAQAGRRHELWRHSCFEVFFATPGKAAYWEVNLCPSGCWNVYHFAGYRSGMREETTIAPPLCQVVTDADLLSMTCTLNLSGLVDEACQLDIGVAAVIEAADGTISYWALDHLGEQPDFHDRRSFLLSLP
ncbi:DOMON-like domain-containing protein [Desulfocastanea catecholica]